MLVSSEHQDPEQGEAGSGAGKCATGGTRHDNAVASTNEPLATYERGSSRPYEASDSHNPRPDNTNQNASRRRNNTASMTDRQRPRRAQVNSAAPEANGEHSTVSAYTISMLQHDPLLRRRIAEQTGRWSQEIPDDLSSGHASSIVDDTPQECRKSKVLSYMRSACPVLRRRTRPAADDSASSTLPPNRVPRPHKLPRTAPTPAALRRRSISPIDCRRPDTPYPNEEDDSSEGTPSLWA